MATVKTQQACDNFMASPLAQELHVLNVVKETRTVPDKHPSRTEGEGSQGVQVIVWAKISDAVCNEVLSCSARRLNDIIAIEKERSIRNGNFGCNSNAASVIAAMFIACGQNAASVAEASWSQFTPEYNQTTKELKLTMFFSSLPIAVPGGGNANETQKKSLQLLKCEKPGMNRRLAGLIGAFALASGLSTSAAVASSTFTESHEVLAKGRMRTGNFLVPHHEL
jgi:hydroxymethylglutaryl-CoA reductase